jgi:hypothetical protein
MKFLKSFYYFIYPLIGFVYRFLFGNLYGVGLLSIFLYFFSSILFDTKPLSFPELVIWLDSQPSNTKGLVISSLLTIVGFSIAFASAQSNWRQQIQSSFRIQAANDIDITYTEICRLITSLKIYTDNLLKIIKNIEDQKDENIINSSIDFAILNTPKFIADRHELNHIHINSYNLLGRYSLTLFATGKTMQKIVKLNESVSNISKAMWQVIVPESDSVTHESFLFFLKKLEKDYLEGFSSQCQISHQYVSGVSGMVKGQLIAKFTEVNFSVFFNFPTKGLLFLKFMEKTVKNEKIDDELMDKLEKKMR